MHLFAENHEILVGSRQSPLARAQVEEVFQEVRLFLPNIAFKCVFVETYGDLDLQTSLRTLGKTDFFTREVDQLLLKGSCRLAVHSAKDLPDPLTQGLEVVAITQGKDPSDALVFRPGESLESLPSGGVIATSSIRREEAVRRLRADLRFVDLRGTIGQRLGKLDSGEADGVVIAEAALIRLGLLHLNRLRLAGETVPYQGQLAVMARSHDHEMATLFTCMDTRRLS